MMPTPPPPSVPGALLTSELTPPPDSVLGAIFTLCPGNVVELVVLGLSIAATACALFLFVRANRHAWLKTAMHAWYTACSVYGLAAMITMVAYPWTGPYWVLGFNLFCQCTGVTGILDVMQLWYCAPRLLTVAETNAYTMRLCVAAYALAGLGFVSVCTVYAMTGTGLDAYRIATSAVIFLEVLGYWWYVPRAFCPQPHAPNANYHPFSLPLCAGCSPASLVAPGEGRSSRLASTMSPRSSAALASCSASSSG